MEFNNIKCEVESMKCIVFGAGNSGRKFLENKSSEVEIVAVVDNDINKWSNIWLGGEERGYIVDRPEKIQLIQFEYIIICSWRYEEIEGQLLSMGIDIDKIIYEESIYDYRYSEFYKYKLWRFYNEIYNYVLLNKIVMEEYKYYRMKEKCSRLEATNYIMLKHIGVSYDSKLSTLNDKIRYLEMNTYGNLERMCADKYKVRKYVEYVGLRSILIPQYIVVEDIESLDLNNLPDKFVLKQNNGCAMNYICKDKNKIDKAYLKKIADRWSMRKIEMLAYEWHYEGIKLKYIIEQLLEDDENERIKDYKFFCCNGEISCILVCVDRDLTTCESYHYYYDSEWNALDYADDSVKQSPPQVQMKPKGFEEMSRIAEKLAKPFPFVRVDLYNIGGKVYFGELTFTPCGGMITIQNKYAQEKIGSMIDINYMANENERIFQEINWDD